MSHSTVRNTTVKTRPTLVKQVWNLRVALHACKRNAPVSVKKRTYTTRYMCVCANNQPWLWVCIPCIPVIKNQISSRQLHVSVCNGSDPGRAKENRASRCMYVCARGIKRGYACVCVCHLQSSVDTYLCVCIWISTLLKECDCIRQIVYC